MHGRRRFLRHSLASLAGTGLFSAFGNLRVLAATAGGYTFGSGDYKALLCIFLNGGNDSFNTVVPYSTAAYQDYRSSRTQLINDGGLAFEAATLQANALQPLIASGGLPGGLPSDGASYGLHPALAELRGLFNQGHAAILSNVGTLLHPTSRAEYQAGLVAVPPQLFSHSDQTTYWQTSRPDDANASGWGGRIADRLHAANTGAIPMCISLSNNNLFQRGDVVDSYSISPGGVEMMSYLGGGPQSWVIGGPSTAGTVAWNALMEEQAQHHLFERAYASRINAAVDHYDIVDGALAGAPELATEFPNTSLGRQLKMAAQLIQVRTELGMSRQVFYASVGNYDTHSYQVDNQHSNLAQLSQAIAAFHAATVELGVADAVTTFTASDFGRSLAVNGDGTDHGWGGHHFIVGGAVRGQRFYGALPSLRAHDNPDDTGYGQVIPTTALDQYAATLAAWFGVSSSDIADIFPALERFERADLGFMA